MLWSAGFVTLFSGRYPRKARALYPKEYTIGGIPRANLLLAEVCQRGAVEPKMFIAGPRPPCLPKTAIDDDVRKELHHSSE